MGGKEREACGRCAMSSVVDATEGDGRDTNRPDPYGEARIEVDEREARLASPGAWIGRVTRRLDAAATRLVYGER